MSQQPGKRGVPRWAVVGGGGLAALLASLLLGPAGQPVQAGEPVVRGAAVHAQDALVVSVTVTNPDDAKLSGTLRAELIDQADKIVDSKETDVDQGDKTAVYRFNLHTRKKPLDNLKLRYVLGKHRVEAPL